MSGSVATERQSCENTHQLLYTLSTGCVGTSFRDIQQSVLIRAYSETKAAFPRTVSSTIRYKTVPQNQWPESRPFCCLRSPQNKMTENPNVTFVISRYQNALNREVDKDIPDYGITRSRPIARKRSL